MQTKFQKFLNIPVIRNSVLWCYTHMAVLVLTLVLLGAASFFLSTAVFFTNSSWAAPVILSKSSPRIASLAAEVLRAHQSENALKLAIEGRKGEIELLQVQKTRLTDLIARFEKSLQVQANADSGLGGQLGRLVQEKQVVDKRAAALVKQNKALEHAIDKELAAGIITAEAAARARNQIVTAEASLNNGEIGTASLHYQVRDLAGGVSTMQGGAASPRALENVARLSALEGELAETDLKIALAEKDLTAKQKELSDLTTFLATLTNSPYYTAMNSDRMAHAFAFVPYDNRKSAAVGAEVYACKLKIVFCSYVGTVAGLTDDEEKGRHPMFPTDVRGVLVDLKLTKEEAAKDMVLFFGSKPLFF